MKLGQCPTSKFVAYRRTSQSTEVKRQPEFTVPAIHEVAQSPHFHSGSFATSASSWFAVQTWPRYEKKVSSELSDKRIEVFLPVLKSSRKWSDRQRVVDVPLFPGYVFVRIPKALEPRVAVLRTNGVVNLVGDRGTGTPIPDVEISSVRAVLERDIPFRSHPFLRVGQHVRIRGGALDGMEGTIQREKEDLSLIISVELIQRSLSIRVEGYQIEAA
jgi:transcription antitermination factor NusG